MRAAAAREETVSRDVAHLAVGALAAALGFFSFEVGVARAAPPSGLLRRYEASAECPTRDAAERRLDAHLEGVVPVAPPSFALTVLGGRGEPFVGVLETTEPSGAGSRRELRDANCEEIVWSLVFVAALAVSPEAKTLPPERSSEPAPPAVPSPAASSPSLPNTAPPSPAPPSDAANPRPTAVTRALAFEVGPQLRLGPLPSLGYGAEARVSFGYAALAAGFVTAPEEGASVGRATFVLVTARPQICPLRSAPGARSPFRVEACAGLEAGVLNASSEGLQDARSVPALWLAGEIAARAALEVSSSFFVAVDVRGGVPLHRPAYTTNSPLIAVYEVPPVVGGLTIFAGLSWK